jgi:hypothetical protein
MMIGNIIMQEVYSNTDNCAPYQTQDKEETVDRAEYFDGHSNQW